MLYVLELLCRSLTHPNVALAAQRWSRVSNPDLDKGQWTIGACHPSASKSLRSSALTPHCRTTTTTAEEELLLKRATAVGKRWSSIALPGRSDVQCRAYYCRVMATEHVRVGGAAGTTRRVLP